MGTLFKFGGVLKVVGGLLTGLGTKFIDLFKEKGPAATEAVKEMADDMVPASKNIGKSIENVGVAAKNSALGIFAMGTAIALVGAGIYAILSGLAELVSSFKDLTGEQIVGALAAIAGTLVLVGIGLKILIPVLAGAAVTAKLAALPLLAVGAAITMIGFGISLIIGSVADAIDSLTGLSKTFGNFTSEGAAAVAAMASELGKFSDIEVEQELTTFTKHLGTLMVESAKVTPESAAAVKTIFQETATLAAVEVNDNTELLEAIANLVKASTAAAPAAAAVGAAGGDEGGQMAVTVNIDGREAWRGIRPYYVKEFK